MPPSSRANDFFGHVHGFSTSWTLWRHFNLRGKMKMWTDTFNCGYDQHFCRLWTASRRGRKKVGEQKSAKVQMTDVECCNWLSLNSVQLYRSLLDVKLKKPNWLWQRLSLKANLRWIVLAIQNEPWHPIHKPCHVCVGRLFHPEIPCWPAKPLHRR